MEKNTTTVILKAAKFGSPMATQSLCCHVLSGEKVAVIQYPDDKYLYEYSEKFAPVLPAEIPHSMSAIIVEDNYPVTQIVFDKEPGVFIFNAADNSTVTVNFNKRMITIEHDRLFGDFHITLNFHYKKEQVA